jgi:hypothetical protein
MAQMERREGSGVLFTNKDKTNPKGPDLQGELKLDQDYKAGDVIKLSGWIRQTSVAPLYSLVIKLTRLEQTSLSNNILKWSILTMGMYRFEQVTARQRT